MDKQKIGIGLVIRDMLKEKKISVSKVAATKDMTRGGIYATFSRISMTNEEIKEWAEILGVESQDILDRTQSSDSTNPSKIKSDFGSEIIERLERLFQEELREKNRQIERLQAIVDRTQESLQESQRLASALLGKLHEYPTSPVMPLLAAAPLLGATA